MESHLEMGTLFVLDYTSEEASSLNVLAFHSTPCGGADKMSFNKVS